MCAFASDGEGLARCGLEAEAACKLKKTEKHDIDVVIDRLKDQVRT
jgi:excinuclease UvrABC ATPase subunit